MGLYMGHLQASLCEASGQAFIWYKFEDLGAFINETHTFNISFPTFFFAVGIFVVLKVFSFAKIIRRLSYEE